MTSDHPTTDDGRPLVPQGVLDGIDDVANENFATKEEIREALKYE